MNPIENLYRYPVKGLSPEAMTTVALTAGQGFPLDRKFAITNGAWDFVEQGYSPRVKTDFLVQVYLEQLAEYRSAYDSERNVLSLASPDGRAYRFDLGDPTDKAALAAILHERFSYRLKGKPELVQADGIRFTDVSVISEPMMNAISLINLASVDAFSGDVGHYVDPLRFRANIYFRTRTPWEELDWVGRDLRIGDALGKVMLRTKRCNATDVNPSTAKRDMRIPKTLMEKYGHPDMGVYIEVTAPGEVKVGDALVLM